MRAPSFADGGLSTGRLLKLLALLWLAGTALRVTILAVPPAIPLIHRDLHMSETQVGLLVGLPLVVFALAAVPGSLLIARFGAIRTVTAGMIVTAFAAAARGGAPDVALLYAATLAMGFGIAIMQPALPTLVKEWLPQRVVLGTAVSTNGMLVGVAAGPALTIPVVLPLLDNSWRLDFLFWSIPVFLAALLFLLAAPREMPRPQADNDNIRQPRRWWPDWKNPLIWLLGLTFGSNNALYYGVNAFLPDYLTHTGNAALIGPALGWCNVAQLVASFVLLATADKLQRRAWPYLVFGPAALLGVAGIVFGGGFAIVLAAGLVGFSLAITFVVTLALPPVLSPADDVHRMAGGMFTISYTCAVVVPVVCGALWDLTGVPWTVFIPVALCGVTLTGLGFFLSMTFLAKAAA
jgi:CP family cyanate transporter-like MFS transporter